MTLDIDWKVFWTALVASLTGTGILVTIGGWLLRKWLGVRIQESVKHEYATRLEDHKHALQAQQEVAVRELEAMSRADGERRATDKSVFWMLLAALPPTGSIAFLRTARPDGFSIPAWMLDELRTFCTAWSTAEHRFLDSELEAKREALRLLICDFVAHVAEITRDLPDGRWLAIPPHLSQTEPGQFRSAAERANQMAADVVGAYDELVSIGRSRLRC